MPIQIWPPKPPGPWWTAPQTADDFQDLVGVGLSLDTAALLRAYRAGMFPMGLGRDGGSPMGWWSPDPRGVLLPGMIRVSRSLRKAMRTFDFTLDAAFDDVVAACADPSRQGRWITPAITEAYTELHRTGWAHSVEVWRDGALVGGLYGVSIGGLFAGESMFHRVRDASKAAFVTLAERVFERTDDVEPSPEGTRRLIDTQWRTDHLATLGVVAIRRADYLRRLPDALASEPIWRAD